jgi:hypothetical protein
MSLEYLTTSGTVIITVSYARTTLHWGYFNKPNNGCEGTKTISSARLPRMSTDFREAIS